MSRTPLALVRAIVGLTTLVLVATACAGATPTPSGAPATTAPASASSSASAATKQYTIGVSNTLQGNGWREEMICSIKAEAKVSGQVSKVTIVNRNTDTAGQIQDLNTLISAGVDAIILNPTSSDALNDTLKQAIDKGIVVVAVDQSVTAPGAYVLSNDQEQYGYLGAKWLFDKLGGTGNVVYMRGIKGVPADTDRDTGFHRALAAYPNIKVVKETFTGWDIAKGAQQIQDIFNSGLKFDGIWTSGIDASVVAAFKTVNRKYVPIVGADNNQFVGDLDTLKADGLVGAAVTNPPPVGGAGLALALKVLNKQPPAATTIKLTPVVWDNTTTDGLQTLKGAYDKNLSPYYATNYTVPDWTHYTKADLTACQGP